MSFCLRIKRPYEEGDLVDFCPYSERTNIVHRGIVVDTGEYYYEIVDLENSRHWHIHIDNMMDVMV